MSLLKQRDVNKSCENTCAQNRLFTAPLIPWSYWLTLVGVLWVSLLVRLHGLGDRSLWFDEAFSWMLADQFSISEMLERTADDVHPPLYYLVLRAWMSLFGSSEFAMRSLSAILGTCTAFAAFVLVRECLRSDRSEHDDDRRRRDGWNAGILAAAACAVSAFHIEWSQEMRMYSMATFLALLSAWALMRALASNLGRYWTLFAFSATCLVYTLNYGLFTVLGQGAFAMGWLWTDSRKVRSESGTGSRMWRAVAVFSLVAGAYSPWIPAVLAQHSRVQESYWIASLTWSSIPDALTDLFLPRSNEAADRTWLGAVFAALLVGAVLGFARIRDWRRNFLIVNALAPITCSAGFSLAFAGIVVPRQLLISYVFLLCILAVLVIDVIPSRVCKFALAATIILGLCIHWEYRSSQTPSNAQPGVKGAIADLMLRRQSGEPIIILHPTLMPSAVYYLPDGATPKLFYPPDQVRHYLGRPILRDSDFFSPDDLAKVETNTVWTVSTGSSRDRLSFDWIPEKGTRRTFPEARRFLGDIVVMKHVRHDQ